MLSGFKPRWPAGSSLRPERVTQPHVLFHSGDKITVTQQPAPDHSESELPHHSGGRFRLTLFRGFLAAFTPLPTFKNKMLNKTFISI